MLSPTAIQSSNSSTLNLFTGIFYTIRILGAGNGYIRPSSIPSANGGIYLEQDILSDYNNITSDSLWSFSPSSVPGFYEWRLYSQPGARVTWTPGESEDEDFPLQLRNMSEVIQDIYEDPSSSLWDFEVLNPNMTRYKIRPMNFGQFNSGSVTFTPKPRSPRGWWLQLNKDFEQDSDQDLDRTVLFQPSSYKLYGKTEHMDLGDVEEILSTARVKEYVSKDCLRNPSPNTTLQNVTVNARIQYDVYVEADKEFDIFSGITVINLKTEPSRKYFDLETHKEKMLNLKGVSDIVGIEEVEIEPFCNTTISSYVTYLKEFKGLRYQSWTDVTAVADLLSNGQVIRNVLVEDTSLLKHLIRGKGYTGKFWEVPHHTEGKGVGAQIRIRTEGVLRGSLPIPFVQFEEGVEKCD